jgi:hypothetical protein
MLEIRRILRRLRHKENPRFKEIAHTSTLPAAATKSGVAAGGTLVLLKSGLGGVHPVFNLVRVTAATKPTTAQDLSQRARWGQ